MPVEYASLTIDMDGRRFPFRYNTRTRHEIKGVIAGQTYPEIVELSDARVIVDVGASVGSAALFFACVYPGAAVYAFEPHRESCEIARENLAPLSNVQLFPIGLHDHDHTAELFLGDQTHTTNSLRAGALFNGTATETVDLRRASTFLAGLGIDQIDILKIDTEGCELPILRDILTRYRPRAIHLEYHSDADRRALDTLLESYVVHSGTAYRPHLGVVTYLHPDAVPSHLARAGIGTS